MSIFRWSKDNRKGEVTAEGNLKPGQSLRLPVPDAIQEILRDLIEQGLEPRVIHGGIIQDGNQGCREFKIVVDHVVARGEIHWEGPGGADPQIAVEVVKREK